MHRGCDTAQAVAAVDRLIELKLVAVLCGGPFDSVSHVQHSAHTLLQGLRWGLCVFTNCADSFFFFLCAVVPLPDHPVHGPRLRALIKTLVLGSYFSGTSLVDAIAVAEKCKQRHQAVETARMLQASGWLKRDSGDGLFEDSGVLFSLVAPR